MKFKYKLSVSISAHTLRRLYAALEEEEKPFTANIRKIAKDARKGDKTHGNNRKQRPRLLRCHA